MIFPLAALVFHGFFGVGATCISFFLTSSLVPVVNVLCLNFHLSFTDLGIIKEAEIQSMATFVIVCQENGSRKQHFHM